jgi:hypothetical protein
MRRAIAHDAVERLTLAECRSVASLRVAPGGSFAKIFGGGFVLGCLGRSGREYVLEQSDVRSDRPASRFTLRGAFNRSAIQRI